MEGDMCFREGDGDSVGHALLLGKDLDLFRGKETSGIQSDSIMQNRGTQQEILQGCFSTYPIHILFLVHGIAMSHYKEIQGQREFSLGKSEGVMILMETTGKRQR